MQNTSEYKVHKYNSDLLEHSVSVVLHEVHCGQWDSAYTWTVTSKYWKHETSGLVTQRKVGQEGNW